MSLHNFPSTYPKLSGEYFGMEAASMDDEAEFKLFYKQEEALEYIATAGPEFRIFSREKKVGGSRVHQVYPSCQHFCEAYANYEDSYKTFYEVIPVGCPAKLYFDLEFPKELNPHSDGEKMVKIFLAAVEAAVRTPTRHPKNGKLLFLKSISKNWVSGYLSCVLKFT
jgi:hypothetical protein